MLLNQDMSLKTQYEPKVLKMLENKIKYYLNLIITSFYIKHF